MPTIDLYGTEHYYELTVPVDTGAPPLVLVHGWCGSARYWQPLVDTYRATARCLVYDLRGFGRSRLGSASSRDFSLESYCRDLALLLDRLGLDRVDLNAHSMGASIGLTFANLYPERVRRLVLTCTGVFQYQMLLFESFYLASNLVIAARPPWIVSIPAMRRAFQRRFVHRLLPDTVARTFIEDYVVASAEAARGTLTASIGKHATFAMPDAFRALSRPTLLISGEFDQIIPAAGARRAVEINPSLALEVIPDTAHFPMLEAPVRYLSLLSDFLDASTIADC
jgi:proline iminopeptidase